ncbi:hypothetical protein [Rehaibacterium terrae]|uniref:Uncharacterized protein n=1 Tax=Rehaibacterium terrae TaxID=1341696 RepID=A0A7W7Y1W4_9GAMM|nr:hypothetical protein [Rehaibacterium terrae]MBB5016584.1 hypothetical protein [Rehaibacterium terrae]
MRVILRSFMVAMGVACACSAIAGKIDGGMPHRISMNVSVPKQTQGATFGERVNAGLQAPGSAVAQGASLQIVAACDGRQCVVHFPGGEGMRADLQTLQLAPAASGVAAVGVIPGGAIVSAVVSALSPGNAGGGAASAAYAATGRAAPAMAELPSREAGPGQIDVTEPLTDGEYLLTLVVEKGAVGDGKGVENAVSGLKGALKTQARTRASARVRIELAFQVQDGALRARHDSPRNNIANVR